MEGRDTKKSAGAGKLHRQEPIMSLALWVWKNFCLDRCREEEN